MTPATRNRVRMGLEVVQRSIDNAVDCPLQAFDWLHDVNTALEEIKRYLAVITTAVCDDE